MKSLAKTRRRFDCLIYSVDEVAEILSLSRVEGNKLAHDALETGKPFIVRQRGRRLLISKPSFDAWLESEFGITSPPTFSEV